MVALSLVDLIPDYQQHQHQQHLELAGIGSCGDLASPLSLVELIPQQQHRLAPVTHDCIFLNDNGIFGHLAPMGQDNFVELVEQQALGKLADLTDDHGFDYHNSYDIDDNLNDNDDNDSDDYDGSVDNGFFGLVAPMGQDNFVELADLSRLADMSGDFGLTAQADAVDACLDKLLNFISLESGCNPEGDVFVSDTSNTVNSTNVVCPRDYWWNVARIFGEAELTSYWGGFFCSGRCF